MTDTPITHAGFAAIIGAPNAGKSTLLNRLAGRDAAIVTSTPGTTRDVIEVRRVMGGQVVWLSDTAGLRETQDEIEAEGVRRAERVAAEADLRLFMVDGGAPELGVLNSLFRQTTDIGRRAPRIRLQDFRERWRWRARTRSRTGGLHFQQGCIC